MTDTFTTRHEIALEKELRDHSAGRYGLADYRKAAQEYRYNDDASPGKFTLCNACDEAQSRANITKLPYAVMFRDIGFPALDKALFTVEEFVVAPLDAKPPYIDGIDMQAVVVVAWPAR